MLSPEQDPFFARHLYDNFGDLGAHVKTYVSDYQARSSSSGGGKIETVADMKRFVEAYPEIRKLGGNVSKHVALVGELSRLVGARKLLEVSEVEQSLATNESHASDLKSVQDLIVSPEVPSEAKLRLAILYALRYQRFNGNYIAQIVAMLPANGVPESDAAVRAVRAVSLIVSSCTSCSILPAPTNARTTCSAAKTSSRAASRR